MAILMTKSYWMESPLSIARHYGGVRIKGHEYTIVGSEHDLVRGDFVGFYDKLGRDRFIEIVKVHNQFTGKELKRLMQQAIDEDKRKAQERKAAADKLQLELF